MVATTPKEKEPGSHLKPLPTFTKLPAEKRDRIIRVALEEFSAQGYQKTSINTLVKRLGIAKGSIFQYFSDKDSLFLYVFNLSLEQVKDYLRTVRDETADADFFVRIEKTLRAGVRFIKAHPRLYRLYLRALFEPQVPFRNTILLALRQYSQKYLRGLIDDGRRRGELDRDLDADVVAFVLDAVLDRFLQSQCVEYLDGGLGLYQIDELDAERWITHIRLLLQSGLGTDIRS